MNAEQRRRAARRFMQWRQRLEEERQRAEAVAVGLEPVDVVVARRTRR